MFEASPEIDRMVARIYALTEEMDRGDTLTRETIQKIVGSEPNCGPWQHVMNKVRRNLMANRGITMLVDRGFGYRMLTHQETLTVVPERRLRRAGRQIRRGRKELGCLPNKELSVHRRNVKAMMLAALENAAKEVRRNLKRHQAEAKRTEVNPNPYRRNFRQTPDAQARP